MRAKDPKALHEWYKDHLGVDVQDWGGATFSWANEDGTPQGGTTVWSIGKGENFKPGNATFMVNYRVEDLDALLLVLREEGCYVLDETEDSEFGKFGWVLDPEQNKVELWEPPAGQ